MANFRTIGVEFDAGLRAPHYTNGRLLTAEDLQRDQSVVLERLSHLGRGVGFGVIEGLRVSAVSANRSLRISAGIGVNRRGDVVRLAAESITLPIQPIAADGEEVRRAGRFEACNGDEIEPSTPLDSGAYLLAVAPLARLEGSAPRYACDGTETATCANQWEVEGVEFKIIRLTAYQRPTGNRSQRNRNLLAHWFYGSAALDQLMRNPFDFEQTYTGFSNIAAADLTDCDLPLAAFFWDDSQIAFVDEWAARRRLYHPAPAKAWRANISDQRVAEGESRFVQFQTETAELQQHFGVNTRNIRATTHYAYLPPVGLLPINPFELIIADVFEQSLTQTHRSTMKEFGLSNDQVFARVQTGVLGASNQGSIFNLARFFGSYLPDTYTIVNEDEIHTRLHQSWVQPAIQLPAPPSTPTSPVDDFFNLTLADNTAVAVTSSNFQNILSTFRPGLFASNMFRTNTTATLEDSMASVAAIHSRAFTPDWYFAALAEDEVEPLVDILVIDEVLSPYYTQLTAVMPAHITAAITALVSGGGGGGVILDSNLTAVLNSFANALMINNLMALAANTGSVAISDWRALQAAATPPLFYVVFVRHQRARRSHRLRL